MKKTLSFLTAMTLLCGVAYAQEEEQASMAETNPSGGEQVLASVAQYAGSLEEKLNAVAKKAKLTKAARKGKAAFSIKLASIGCKPDDENYATARQLAFDRAFLEAKSDITRTLAAQIKSSAELALMTGKLAEGQNAVNDKIQKMVNDKVTELLTEQGVDMEDEAAVKAALPKVRNSAEFKQATETAATAYLIGVQAFATVSDGQSVAVLATYSDLTRDMALAMFTGAKFPQNGNRVNDIEEMLDGIEANVLANTFGLRVYFEDDGEDAQAVIVSFVQAQLASDSASSKNIANAKARIMAERQYREFAGQNVTIAAALAQSQNITELSNNLGELSAIDETFSQKCMAIGEKLQISGINPLDSKLIVLPSGHKILCACFAWTPESVQFALKSVQKNRQAEAIVNQGPRMRPDAPAPAAPKPAPQAAPIPKKYKNQGTQGAGLGGGAF